MTHGILVGGTLGLALAVGASGNVAASPKATLDRDVAALDALNAAVNAANAARDAGASVAFDADDIVSSFPGGPVIHGKAGDLAAARAGFKDPAYAYSQTVERTEVAGAGDMAFQTGRYEMTLTSPATHAPMRLSGYWLATFRKGPDGLWKYAAFAGTPAPTAP
jgi:ketosteroid isomerase-like protein